MAFCHLVFPLLVLSVVQCYKVQVPVFLWGNLAQPSLKSNPLSTVSVEDFDGILSKEIQNDPFTVIFIEETLSVEDFSLKNEDGETSYPYLHANIGKSLYLPSVENPLRVLNKLADPEKVDHVKLTENGLSAEIQPQSGKFLFINLKDAREGESRSELLYRHNNFMEKMFNQLQQQYSEVVAVYTAHNPSWTVPDHSRVRRQTNETNDFIFQSLRLYLETVLFHNKGNDEFLTGLTAGGTTLNGTEMNSTLIFSGSNQITLNFVSKGGYWLMNTVTLTTPTVTEELIPKSEVYAQMGFSFACGQNITYRTSNETKNYGVTFQTMRIQPYFNTNTTNLTWGEPYYCVGFFSAAIWAGLFVVACLLAITFYGIMMMMDIRTMDRFDDPKGKTITINTVD